MPGASSQHGGRILSGKHPDSKHSKQDQEQNSQGPVQNEKVEPLVQTYKNVLLPFFYSLSLNSSWCFYLLFHVVLIIFCLIYIMSIYV